MTGMVAWGEALQNPEYAKKIFWICVIKSGRLLLTCMSIFVMVTWKKHMRMDWLTGCARLDCGLSSNILSKFWMKTEWFLETTTPTDLSRIIDFCG
jgi:hypothetical protein